MGPCDKYESRTERNDGRVAVGHARGRDISRGEKLSAAMLPCVASKDNSALIIRLITAFYRIVL